ncbi:MAG: PAS domain-containing protein [Thermodesulfobacteriota bacterium]
MAKIQGGAALHTCETTKKTEGGDDRHYIVTATPLIGVDGALEGIIESFQDITPRVRLEKQKEELIVKLRIALESVRQLQKLLPICSSCKKIRDDQGYWMQLESYFGQHSEISFTHGLCPGCAEKLYGVLLRPEPEEK